MKRIGKRLLALLLATTMLVTLLPASALAASPEDLTSSQADSQTETAAETPAAAAFTDVPAGAWFREAVEYVYSHDIFNGTSDDTFSPHGTMTRAMTVTVLGRVAQVDPANYAGTSAFTDVAADSWYAPYVAWAVAAGITDGVGQGLFAPNEPVTRVQMAAFLWRFFQHIGAQLPEDVTDGLPEDYSSIPAYAREAVAALWRCGIFQGDGDNNFTPSRELTRAEVAMLCMRVDTHLVDTGAKSYPDAAEETPGEETDAADNTGSSGSNGNRPGGSGGNRPGGSDEPDEPSDPSDPSEPGGSPEDLYYEPDATENQTTATAQNVDPGFSITVESSNTGLTAEDVKSLITATDASESGGAATSCIEVSGSGGTYTITGRHIDYASVDEHGNPQWVSGFAPGHTYKIVLEDDRLTFAGQDDTVREYDFTVARQEEMNLELADGMVYIPAGSISDIIVNDQPVDELDVALVRVGENGTETNASEDTTGRFTYSGGESIQIGDIVAVYEGLTPLERTEDTETDGEDVISYVKITGVNGNTYTFEGAEMDEVLKTPDIFPLPVSYITDDDSTTADDGGTITVPASAFVFSGDLYTQMGLDSSATVDVGDYIAFYSGYLDPAASDAGEKFSAEATQQYAEITDVDFDENDDYTITYTMVTLDDILSSMNTYVESDVDVAATLTPEDIADLENSLESQAVTSGFAQEAAMEIARAALQADSLDQVRDEFGLASLSVTGVGVSSGGGALATSGGSLLTAPGGGGNKVQVEVNYTGIRASVGTALQHFKGMSGLRVELTIPFTVSIQQSAGWALEIEFHPTFIQELRIGVNASVDTIWDNWAYIIWWIDDFKVTASIDVYTFTDIDIDITVTSSDGQEDTPEKIEKLTNFVDEIKSFLDGGGADEEEAETLAERYVEMLENDSDWVDLFSKSIYSVKKTLALVVTIWVNFDFVVSANVNVYIGLDFTYELGRRYIFTIMVFGGQATSDTVSLVPEEYSFTLYVMGKLGLRAGLRITIGVALIHKSVASAELVAEIGPYIELYGFCYYRLYHLEGQPTTSEAAGAMYVEVGLYAEMSANLSAIGGLLSWNPEIFSLTLPLWSAGNRYPVVRAADQTYSTIGFNFANPGGLPNQQPALVVMDLKTGKETTLSFGWNEFKITTTNDAVWYDPQYHVLWARTPIEELDLIEEGEVVITWTGDNGCLAFNTVPIHYTIPFQWNKMLPGGYQIFLITETNPSWIEYKMSYGLSVNYNTPSEYNGVIAGEVPADFSLTDVLNSREGYRFIGWKDESGNYYPTTAENPAVGLPATMPAADDRATYYYAQWEEAPRPYTVERYYEVLDGEEIPEDAEVREINGQVYTLQDTDTYDAYVGEFIDGGKYTPEPGFTAKPNYQGYGRMSRKGNIVLECFYDRNSYNVSFRYYAGTTAADENLVKEYNWRFEYATEVTAPQITAPQGYHVADNAWVGSDGSRVTPGGKFTIAAQDVVYTATLAPNEDTPFTVELYVQQDDGNYSSQPVVTTRYGTTDTTVGENVPFLPDYSCEYDGNVIIKADGSTVVKVRCTQTNLHTVTFYDDMEDGRIVGRDYFHTGDATAELEFPTLEREGYVHSWVTAEDGAIPDKMPGGNVNFYAKWTEGEGTTYRVDHYLQNADGTYPATANYTDNKTGVTNAQVEVTRPADISTTLYGEGIYDKETTIAANGATVVRVEYPRTTFSITYHLNGPAGTTPSFTDKNLALNEDGSYTVSGILWGAGLTGKLLTGRDVSLEDYGWTGWYTDAACKTKFADTEMPDRNIDLYAGWAAGVGYTVNYYLETADVLLGDSADYTGWILNDDGSGRYSLHYKDYDDYYRENGQKLPDGFSTDPDNTSDSDRNKVYKLATSETGTTTAGTSVTPAPQDHPGFITPTAKTVTVEADGSTEVNYYYDRRTYTLNIADADGDSHEEQKAADLTVRYGTDLTGLELMRGYTVTGLYTDSSQQTSYDPVNGAYSETLTLYPDWEGVKYTVKIHVDWREDFVTKMRGIDGVSNVTADKDYPEGQWYFVTIDYAENVAIPAKDFVGSFAALQMGSGSNREDVTAKTFNELYLGGNISTDPNSPTRFYCRWDRGNGTSDNPLKIYTVAELLDMGNDIGGLQGTEGVVYVTLVEDFNLATIPDDYTLPIHVNNKVIFLEGDNHTISNITTEKGGIFSLLLEGSTIQNLTITGAKITGADTVTQSAEAGVLASSVTVSTHYSGEITLNNVSVTGSIVLSDVAASGDNPYYIGGLVGHMSDSITMIVENCKVEVGIQITTAEGHDPEQLFVGSLVGYGKSYYTDTVQGDYNANVTMTVDSGEEKNILNPVGNKPDTNTQSPEGNPNVAEGGSAITETPAGDPAAGNEPSWSDPSALPPEETPPAGPDSGSSTPGEDLTGEEDPAGPDDEVGDGDASQPPDGGTDEPTEETEADAETPPVFEETGVSAPGTGLPGTTGGLDAAALPVERPRLLRGSRPARL